MPYNKNDYFAVCSNYLNQNELKQHDCNTFSPTPTLISLSSNWSSLNPFVMGLHQ